MQTNNSDEAEAILNVIDAETQAFWKKDYQGFHECWCQEPWIMRAGWWERGGVTWRQGWEDISDRIKQQFAANPAPNPSAEKVRRENINIRVGTDMAWVTFDQYAPDAQEPDMDMPGLSHETRILEKHDGCWKLVYLGYLLT